MKRRRYLRVVYEGWTKDGAIEGVLATKTYYLKGNRIGRIDFFDRERGLYQVSYRDVEPPFGALLQQHWRQHPGVRCEIVTPACPTPEGLSVVRTRLYAPGNVLDGQYEIYSDDTGALVRQIEIGRDGERVQEERPVYDQDGMPVGREIYGPDGSLVDRFLDSDETDRDLA